MNRFGDDIIALLNADKMGLVQSPSRVSVTSNADASEYAS